MLQKRKEQMMAKNDCGKTRDVKDPYEIWRGGGWEWRVLKKVRAVACKCSGVRTTETS